MKPLEMNPVCEHDQTEQRKCHSALPFLLITVVDLVVFSSMYCILQGLDKGPATICAFRNYISASKCIGAPDPLHCCARFMSPATCDAINCSGCKYTRMCAITKCSFVLSNDVRRLQQILTHATPVAQ